MQMVLWGKKIETSCKRYSASVRWLGLRSKGGGSYFFITRLICERTAALIPTPIFWAREKVIQENGLNSSPAGCRSGTDVCPAVAGDPQRPRQVLGRPGIGVRLNQWTKMPFNKKKRKCKEWSRTPPFSTNKKVRKLKKEHLEEVGPGEHERGTKLALGHVEQAWWGARLPWAEAPVWNSWCCGSLCSFSGPWVCLFVGFGLHEWRNMVHTLVTWVLIGSAENVGRWNKPGNRQSHVF